MDNFDLRKYLAEGKLLTEDKVVSEKQTTNEILGFSEREKEIKSMKQDFDKAREEIKKFNINILLIDNYDNSLEAVNITHDKARNILIGRLRSETDGMPTYYKILTDPKYKEFLDKSFRKFILVDAIVKDGNNTYEGVTIYLPGNPDGKSNLNKDYFEETNLRIIDQSEENLMRQMGGKFLDRT